MIGPDNAFFWYAAPYWLEHEFDRFCIILHIAPLKASGKDFRRPEVYWYLLISDLKLVQEIDWNWLIVRQKWRKTERKKTYSRKRGTQLHWCINTGMENRVSCEDLCYVLLFTESVDALFHILQQYWVLGFMGSKIGMRWPLGWSHGGVRHLTCCSFKKPSVQNLSRLHCANVTTLLL